MIEALTLLLSAITLILQRRDRAKERAIINEAELYTDLLNLHDVAKSWLLAARLNNTAVRHWIINGMPEEVPTRFFESYASNVEMSRAVAEHLEGRGPGSALQKVLAVYAPDVAEQLSRVLADRRKFLDRFAPELLCIKTSPPEEAEELARRLNQHTQDLYAAVEGLGTLIRGLRPIPGVGQ
jgi:hypothetical protein